MTCHKAQSPLASYAPICLHAFCNTHYAFYIMRVKLRSLHYALCTMHHYALLNSLQLNTRQLFPLKMTLHKAQCVLSFECMNYASCIMHYAIKQLHYVWVNSFQILVDFSTTTKICTTKHNEHLFCYACIMNYVSCILCVMQ